MSDQLPLFNKYPEKTFLNFDHLSIPEKWEKYRLMFPFNAMDGIVEQSVINERVYVKYNSLLSQPRRKALELIFAGQLNMTPY